MAFLPPPTDRGFKRAQMDARRERMVGMRQAWAGPSRVGAAARWLRQRLHRH